MQVMDVCQQDARQVPCRLEHLFLTEKKYTRDKHIRLLPELSTEYEEWNEYTTRDLHLFLKETQENVYF